MARKLTYDITRFDGGMSDDIRVPDLSKCAYVSHFDIYCDPHRLVPMPGYIADQAISGDSDGLQDYNIKAFFFDGTLYGVGTKSDGTDCKLWEKATPTTAEWSAVSNGEGTYDLVDKPFLIQVGAGRFWWATVSGGDTYLSYYDGTVTDNGGTLQTFEVDTPLIVEYGFDDAVYINNGADDVDRLNTTSVSDSFKETGIRVSDIQSGDEQYGIFGSRIYPYKSQLLLWDSGSSLIDQKIEFGNGRAMVVGYPAGTWVGVVDENITDDNSLFNEEENGRPTFAIKYAAVGGARTIYRAMAPTNTNGVITPTRSKYQDAMTFYARIAADATPTTYKQGIWAVGKCKDESPLAVSVLLNTEDLGLVEGYYAFGDHHFFAHNEDGSVSRLDDFGTGTYDVECRYDSLMLGSESPYQKEFKGLSVLTEDLPSGATVEAKYRFDEDDSWTSLGTSSTDGDEIHNFTRAAGVPIGRFKEIQFQVLINGKVQVKGMYITLMETDDLPFKH